MMHLEFCNAHFLIRNAFIDNAKLKLAKNQATARQHPEAELLLFENYSLSLSTASSRNNRIYTKNCTKSKYVCLKRGYMINENENETKNGK